MPGQGPGQMPGQGGAASLAGQWGCQYSMQPFNRQPMDTHYWEFAVNLGGNGTYQLQGFYYSPSLGYNVPVQGQGQWGVQPSGGQGPMVALEGQILRQDSGWMPFGMQVRPADASNMYLQFRGNTHETNIVCQRM
jgi:hypothetical protein